MTVRRIELNCSTGTKSVKMSGLYLTNEKHKKIEAVRMVAVGMIVALTRIAMSSSGRRPAPDVTPNPINFRRRSFGCPGVKLNDRIT